MYFFELFQLCILKQKGQCVEDCDTRDFTTLIWQENDRAIKILEQNELEVQEET